MATAARKISQDTWNLHKETILSLYLSSDLTMNKLIQTMDRDHGFSATPSQFEAQLKAWKARKNLKRMEWEELLEKIDHLSSQGIQSRVVISGHPVSTDTVHRARRYCKGKSHLGKRRRVEEDLDETMNNHTTSDALIEVQDQSGIWTQYTTVEDSSVIQVDSRSTPGMAGLDTQLQLFEDNGDQMAFLHDDRASPPGLSNVSSQLLPLGIDFDDSYCTGGSQYFSPFLDLPFVGPEPPASQSFLQHEPNAATAFSTLDVATSPRFVDTIPFRFGTLSPEELPFQRFERELMSRGLKLTDCPSPLQDSHLLFGAPKLTSIFIHEAAIAMACRNEKSHQENFYNAWRTLQTLNTFLPKAQHSYHNGSTALCAQEMSDVDLRRLLLLSAANGFIGMGDIPIETALRFLDHGSNVTSLLSRVFRGNRSQPLVKSLAENLFRASIEACDHQKTKFFLLTGLVDVNNTICFVDGEKRTPLERAAELQGLKVVKELLIFKPDVNQTFTPSNYYTQQVLGYLLKGRYSTNRTSPTKRDHSLFTPDYIEVVDALIEAGAEIRGSHIYHALQDFVDTSLAEMLLNRLTPSFHSEAMDHRIPELIASEFPDDIAQAAMAKIISQCELVGCKACTTRYSDEVNSAILTSAKRGRVRLFQFLLKYSTFSPTQILSVAIRNGNKEVINDLLAQNIDLRRAPAERLDRFDSRVTTPLAEAIIAGDKILIGILEKKIALETLKEGDVPSSQLVFAMSAAAQVGDFNYMKRLLSFHPRITNAEILEVFDTAIKYQREDAVRLFLDIGIRGFETSRVNAKWFFKIYKWGNKSLLLDLMSNIPKLAFDHIDDSSSIRSSKLEDVDMFKFFCKSGRATRSFLTRCLEIAIMHNDFPMLHDLLQQGADATGVDLLQREHKDMLALAAKGHPDMLRILLAHIPPNYKGHPGFGLKAVNYAIGQPNTEVLDILLKYKSIDFESLDFGAAPLWEAIKRDANFSGLNFPFTTRILSTRCDINGIIKCENFLNPSYCLTPLLAAIETRNENLVQFLINRGANINKEARYRVRQTPLQAAAQVGSLDIVELLLQNGADVNAKPALRCGGTALQFAAMSGNCNIAAILVDRGASIYDSPSEFDGIWPIEAAAENGRIDMIQFLWNSSIIGFPIEQCRKAIRLAEKNGHIGCKELILQLAVSSGVMPSLEG